MVHAYPTTAAPPVAAWTPKRIILLTPQALGRDGISTVSRAVIRAMRDYQQTVGCFLECWSLCDREHADIPNPRIAHGSRVRFSSWGFSAGLTNQSETLVVTLHVHLAPVALPFVFRGARLAVFLHGVEAWDKLMGPRAVSVRRAWRVITNSKYTLNRFRAANPHCVSAAAAVCHLGIPAEPPLAEPSTSSGFALIVGRMFSEQRYKGHDSLLDIWSEVLKAVPEAALVVAGDGDDRPRLEAKARTLGLGGHVSFMGPVSDNLLAALYRDCAFFVMPSSSEGFGLVFLEAMRAGRTCVATRGAAAEVIEDKVTGLLVEPGDAKGLKETVIRLFQDSSLCLRMGAEGKRRFACHFTQESFAARFQQALELSR